MSVSFELGVIVVTPGTLLDFGPALIAELLGRHASGDWGDLGVFDWRENDQALRAGTRIFSAYETPAGRVWIITEATDDAGARRSTCILRPEDY